MEPKNRLGIYRVNVQNIETVKDDERWIRMDYTADWISGSDFLPTGARFRTHFDLDCRGDIGRLDGFYKSAGVKDWESLQWKSFNASFFAVDGHISMFPAPPREFN